LDETWSAFLVAASGFLLLALSACEAALYGYSYARLMERAQRKGNAPLVTDRLTREKHIIFALLVYEAIFSSLLVLCVSAWVAVHSTLSPAVTLLISLGISVFLMLVPFRLAAYIWGRDHADAIVSRMLGTLDAIRRPMMPLIRVVDALALVLARMTGRSVDREVTESIADEILSAVAEGESEGVLEENEKEMIERVIDLKDADVADAMTPRTDMIAVPVDTTVRDTVKLAMECGHSRIPVFEGNRDKIVGILYVKDLLRHWHKDSATSLSLRVLMRKPHFVPERKPTGEMLKEFKSRKLHMAVVLDEYGGTAGIITLEDIIEEIFGDIEDEYDPALVVPPLRVLNDTTVEADARLHVDDLSNAIHVPIEDGRDFDSLGGFLCTELGRVPAKGEIIEVLGLRLTVLEANERRIGRVRVERLPDAS
jgi:CBS domain containing-hemolysin-like protein